MSTNSAPATAGSAAYDVAGDPAGLAPQRRHAHVASTLGDLLLVADGPALIGVYFPGHAYPPAADTIGAAADESDPVIGAAARQLREYLRGERREFDLKIHTEGEEFAQRVWDLLRRIPFGGTTTYGELAHQLGDRRRAQAVGQAVGHNPLSIVIPCHRVLGSDGNLRGFAGGLDRKRALLALEEPDQARAERLF